MKLGILKVLMQEMHLLTEPECATVCRRPHSCCDPMYCAITSQYAQDIYGITLEPTGFDSYLPFMSKKGCVVEPYLRPMCTVHTCEINSLGFKKGNDSAHSGYFEVKVDKKWTQEYFGLRDKIDSLMMEIEEEKIK